MVPSTRRRLLQASAAALVFGAGCSETAETIRETDHEGDRPPDDRYPDPEDVFSDLATESLRFDRTDFVQLRDDGENERRDRFIYLVDDEDLDDVSIPDNPADGSVGNFHGFLDRLDFDQETGVIIQQQVGACTRLALQYVERDGSRLRARFCRTYREPDVDCETCDEQLQLTAIAVPVTSESRPRGSGLGSGSSCRLPPEHPAASNENGGDAP